MKKRAFSILVFIVMLLFTAQAFAQSTYIVKSGDTMWKIASRNQVGISEIISANPQVKNPAMIYPGQKLTIPTVTTSAQETEVARLVNVQRSKAGLQPKLKMASLMT